MANRLVAVVVRGDTVTVRARGAEQGTFRIDLDPSDSPRAVRDYERVGFDGIKNVRETVDEELPARQGIYSIGDNTLKLCLVEALEWPDHVGGRKNATLRVLRHDRRAGARDTRRRWPIFDRPACGFGPSAKTVTSG